MKSVTVALRVSMPSLKFTRRRQQTRSPGEKAGSGASPSSQSVTPVQAVASGAPSTGAATYFSIVSKGAVRPAPESSTSGVPSVSSPSILASGVWQVVSPPTQMR